MHLQTTKQPQRSRTPTPAENPCTDRGRKISPGEKERARGMVENLDMLDDRIYGSEPLLTKKDSLIK